MTAAERFDLAARAALLAEQAQALRSDVERHYGRPDAENFVAASAAWWAMGPVEKGLVNVLEALVDPSYLEVA